MAQSMRNSERTGLLVGLAIILAGGLLMLLPPLADMDGFDGGFALQFLGLFLLLVGLVTAAIFAYRARRLEAMFRGQDLLAHWVYDPRQKQEQARRARQRRTGARPPRRACRRAPSATQPFGRCGPKASGRSSCSAAARVWASTSPRPGRASARRPWSTIAPARRRRGAAPRARRPTIRRTFAGATN